MNFPVRLAVWAFVVVTLSAVLVRQAHSAEITTPQSPPDTKAPPTAEIATPQPPADTNAAPTTEIATPKPLPETKAASPEKAGSSPNEKFSEFWNAKASDWAIAIFTLLLVVVGFRQEGISRRQALIMDNQAKIMKNTLDVSQAAATTAEQAQIFSTNNARQLEESSFRHDRAYIWPKELSANHKRTQNGDEVITYKVIFRNYGKTPAKIYQMHTYWSTDASPPSPGPDPDAKNLPDSIDMLGAEQDEPPAEDKKTLSPIEYDKIKNKTNTCYLVIWAKYDDVFGREHVTGITSRYDSDYNAMLPVDQVFT